MEHLWATHIRNDDEWKDKMVYFGPMWCRTGFYTVFKWDLKPQDVLPIITDMIDSIINFEWEIPWAQRKECGNYLDHSLVMAQYESKKFRDEIEKFTDKNFQYNS
jgi:S-ribosylhomocysteine lyase